MPGTGQRQAVFAVVVTHRPQMTALEALLRALRPQVGGLVVVDNASPDPGDALPALARAHAAALIANPRNLGVAAGLNQGIERARAEGIGAGRVVPEGKPAQCFLCGMTPSDSSLR